MKHSYVQLDDLPDEILWIILTKLNNSDVLYSLMGVNKRLDAFVNDSIFTKNVTLITPANKPFDAIVTNGIFTRNLTLIKPFHGLSFQFTDAILNRFCCDILPKINKKIERLNLESSCMERILLATNYLNLHTLGLYNIEPEKAYDLFSDHNHLMKYFTNKIKSITIIIKRREYQIYEYVFNDHNSFVFKQICMKFNNLQYLNFMSSSDCEQLTFRCSPSVKFSSNILELHVVVKSIMDCVCLLNGHFDHLHSLFVTISPRHVESWPYASNRKKLPNLKCFSLIHEECLMMFNEILVQFLQRMINVEELSLYFDNPHGPIIDGNNLSKNIINHMTKLQKFTFNIRSAIRLDNQLNLLSNEDVKNTFKNFENNQITSYVDYFKKLNLFYCHIYSHPYSWKFYYNITNNFPGGLFKCVREISLHDERPFEREFFLKIAQLFPCIEKLILKNSEPQEHKDVQCSIIEFPHLNQLVLFEADESYIEQFLNNTKTYLSNNIYLHIGYDSLNNVTGNFTSDATRMNCSKIIRINVFGYGLELSKLKGYFPNAKIC